MKIIKARRGVNRFGVRKYVEIPSSTKKGKKYRVGKVRVKGSRRYKYVCECPGYFYRQKVCKHIRMFKKLEEVGQV